MEKKKFKKLSFIGIAIVTVMLMDMVIILASASVGGDSATLDDPTEDGYIQWGDYSDYEDPTIIRFADGNQILFGKGEGYWYWYWWPFYPEGWRQEWRAHKERGYVEWDISSLAGKTLTANPIFKYEGGYRPGATDEKINPITEGQPSVISDGDLYSYIASGPAYVDPFNVEGSQNEEVDLGASARSDLQAAMDASQSWFAIGFQANEVGNMRAETDIVAEEAIPTPPPTLYVEYISVANTAPTQTGESPTNGSTGISVTPDLYVLCLDDDADNMNATWWSNSSGSWVQFASNWTSFANNTNITQPFTNATNYSQTYYWSLNLTDGTDWCNETYHFTTEIINPPNAPTSPECDNQTNPGHVLDHTPYFDWIFSDPDGSDTQGGFHIQVGNDTDWGVVERWDNNQSSNTNSYITYSGSTLYDGDTYYWRVKTKDNYGAWGSWTSNQNFRMNSVPTAPNLNSPANNTLHMPYTTGSINLSWNAGTDNESDSLNYEWQYAEDSAFSVDEVSDWSGGPLYKLIPTSGNLDKSTDYYWHIRAWDGLEYGSYSVWRKFTTDDNMAPTQSGEAPTNGSTGVSTTPALYIICNDADGGDTLTATWRSNSSGGWVDFTINTSILPGTNITQTNSDFSEYNTTYYWSVNVTDPGGSERWTNRTYHFTTKANKPSNITGENPANGSTGISLTPVCNVTVSDDDGHTSTVYFYENTTGAWVLQQTNTTVASGTSVVWSNFTNASNFSTVYNWSVNVTDGYGWTNETYNFTTLSEYVPDPPSSFSASASSSSQIDLLWIKGNKADTTYIEWNTASSWSRGDGAELYNNTGTSTSQSGLSAETTRYYQAWSWNNTGGFWSRSYDSTSATTKSGDGGPGPGPGPTNQNPTADANGPYSGDIVEEITFDGSGSSDSDGTITNYTWDFGDNTTGYGVKPIHSYNTSGLYDITLTVKDDNGLTDSNTTTATIALDSDGDGWSDEIEQSYETNITDPDDCPLDTDGDRIPDEDSPDGKYTGDLDGDNDGLDGIIEETLGSDPKDETDVTSVDVEGITYYLVDIDEDGQSNIFYNTITKNSTILGIRNDGTYLIDVDEDSEWDYIYDPVSKTVTPYKEKPSEEFPWLTIAAVGIVIGLIVFIVVIYKKKQKSMKK